MVPIRRRRMVRMIRIIMMMMIMIQNHQENVNVFQDGKDVHVRY
jgi:hypothetical protein